MTLTKYVFIVLAATVLAWVSFAVVLTQINPDTAGLDGFTLFYASLFLALLGSFALMGLSIRLHTQQHHLPYYLVLLSFRQAIFFSVLVVGALLMQSQRVLYWWNMIGLVGVLTLLEFFALKIRRRPTGARASSV